MPITVNGQVPPVKPRGLREKLGDVGMACLIPLALLGISFSLAYERLRCGRVIDDISDMEGTPGLVRQALNGTGRLLGRGWKAIVDMKEAFFLFNPMRSLSDDAQRLAGFDPEEGP